MSPFWKRKQRHVVTNLFIAYDEAAFAPLMAMLTDATRQIVAHGDEFEVASAALARVAGALLDHQAHATHAACFGEIFDEEGAAGAYAQGCFADLSTRYLAASEGLRESSPVEVMPGERRIVVMLTVAYAGEQPELEGDIASVPQLEDALRAIIALHHAGRLLVAHLHHAPSHPEDRLTDEQMLVNYPELLTL